MVISAGRYQTELDAALFQLKMKIQNALQYIFSQKVLIDSKVNSSATTGQFKEQFCRIELAINQANATPEM